MRLSFKKKLFAVAVAISSITALIATSIALAWPNDVGAQVTAVPICNTQTGYFQGDFQVTWNVTQNADSGFTITDTTPVPPQVVNYPSSDAGTSKDFAFTLTQTQNPVGTLSSGESLAYTIIGQTHPAGTPYFGGSFLHRDFTAAVQTKEFSGKIELPVLGECKKRVHRVKITVEKVVINDNGGTKTASDFSFQVNGGPLKPFGTSVYVNPENGPFNITEPATEGYTTTYSNCYISFGEDNPSLFGEGEYYGQTCVVTNNDVAPPRVCPDGNPPTPGEGAYDPNDDCKRPPVKEDPPVVPPTVTPPVVVPPVTPPVEPPVVEEPNTPEEPEVPVEEPAVDPKPEAPVAQPKPDKPVATPNVESQEAPETR